MRKNKTMSYPFFPVILNVVTLLVVLGQAQNIIPWNERKCDDQLCGDVIIRFPFGTTPNCSFDNNYFAVTCNTSSSSSKPIPILTKLNLVLLEIQMNRQFTVNIPAISVCADNNTSSNSNSDTNTSNKVGHWSSLDLGLRGSPFILDPNDNVFVSVGCNGNATVYNKAGWAVSGCRSSCDPGSAPQDVLNGCNGYYCCQRDLDSKWLDNGFNVVVSTNASVSSYNEEIMRRCRSAFLIRSSFLQNNSTVAAAILMTESVIPVVLRLNDAFIQLDSVIIVDRTERTKAKVTGGLQIAIPVFVTLVASCCCIWACWRRGTKGRRKEAKLRAKYFKGRLEKSSSEEQVCKTKLFTIKDLKRATDNFNEDRVLGQGGQGAVYKGMLADGQVVAVKRSITFEESQWKQFINEVILLSQVNHRNVVKLLGCCLETKTPLLVYEFICNGTLSQHIHNTDNKFSLMWEMRVRIASEVANAIAYLHSSSLTPIYHRDVKSTNILLDDKYHAKVADFGISRAVSIDQTHLTTCVQGTFGYLDPEYFRTSQLSAKSDVYSFGVVLVELLTGQKSIRLTTSEEDEKSLVQYFISSMNEKSLDQILHPIVHEGCRKDQIMLVANLANQCLRSRGNERPSMKEVAIQLERLRKKSAPVSVTHQQVSQEVSRFENAVAHSNIDIIGTSIRSPTSGGFEAISVHGNCEDEQPLFSTS